MQAGLQGFSDTLSNVLSNAIQQGFKSIAGSSQAADSTQTIKTVWVSNTKKVRMSILFYLEYVLTLLNRLSTLMRL